MKPLAFASVEIREFKEGNITKEDGSYQLWLVQLPTSFEILFSSRLE